MNIKTTTLAVTLALVASLALPVAAAHWTAGSSSTHEHFSTGASSVTTVIFSTEAQRLCINTGSLVISWSNPSNGACVGRTPIPPLRGITNGFNNCFDLDGIAVVKALPRANGVAAVTLDWGASATGPGSAVPSSSFSDFFAHPNAAAGTVAHGVNPTGASVAFYPGYIATAGPVQLSLTAVGIGTTSNPVVGGPLAPGFDQGDNDAETCYGGAVFTYAIDSADNKRVANGAAPSTGAPVVGTGAGYGLNDPNLIGGDCVYDVTACSPLVDSGDNIPVSSASPKGVLMSPAAASTVVKYSLCNDIANSGCTNIPDTGSASRYGNAASEDAVYASLQDCVWAPVLSTAAHTSGRAYAGQAAEWGTGKANGQSCWPERLSRVSATPGTLFFPSSQATLTALGLSTWKPDHLPATPRGVESIVVFSDEAGVFPFHHFNSGCPDGTTFNPTSPFCSGGPTVDTPDQWVQGPKAGIAANFAVFQ